MRHRKGHVVPRNLTPIDRRRIHRKKRKVKNQVRLAQVLGVLAGLSVTTGLFAHETRGTYAMFASQQTVKVNFKALASFKKPGNSNAADVGGGGEKSSALQNTQPPSKESDPPKNITPSVVKGTPSGTNNTTSNTTSNTINSKGSATN